MQEELSIESPGGNPGLFLKCSEELELYLVEEKERNGVERGGGGKKERGEKRYYRRQDEGTRILFKAEHFTAARSSSGNGGCPATPEKLIRS